VAATQTVCDNAFTKTKVRVAVPPATDVAVCADFPRGAEAEADGTALLGTADGAATEAVGDAVAGTVGATQATLPGNGFCWCRAIPERPTALSLSAGR
jgi:hypothetical protein